MNGQSIKPNTDWIYYNSKNNEQRFVLGKRGNRTLVCIGINPSTATPIQLDNTLKIVERFSKNYGYDSWLMLNIYPQRSTNPDNLDEKVNNLYHKENLKYIDKILKETNCDIRAAWGTLIEKRKYLIDCLVDIYNISHKYSKKWYKIGNNSKQGHPHHPLYLNKNSNIDKFNIDDYIKNLYYNKNIMNKIKIIKDDITKQDTDAIVNAANTTLLGGGGVDGAIHLAGGQTIMNECEIIRETTHPDGLPTTDAVITTGGNMLTKYVIHTVGPICSMYSNEAEWKQDLADCYTNCLHCATENNVFTISFPSISTGIFKCPIQKCANIALQATKDFLNNNDSIKEVRFVLFSDEDLDIYNTEYKKIINSSI